jgi:hypothetical protein
MGKRGRTPSYTPAYCTVAYKFCLLGATNEDLAGVFGVSRNTIGNWLACYPEFKKAMQDGRDVADADVAHALLHKARGFTHEDVKYPADRGRGRAGRIQPPLPARQPGRPLLAAQPPPQAMARADRTRAQRHRREAARAPPNTRVLSRLAGYWR